MLIMMTDLDLDLTSVVKLINTKLIQQNFTLLAHLYPQSCNTYTPCLKNKCRFHFLNNSVKHWPILIIFGTQHQKCTIYNRFSTGTPL